MSKSSDVPSADELAAMLAAIDRTTVAGRRDYALMLLLVTTRRNIEQAMRMQWDDLRPLGDGRYAWRYVYRRWRGLKTHEVTVSALCMAAIEDYLAADGRLATIAAGERVFIRPVRNDGAYFARYAEMAGLAREKGYVNRLRDGGVMVRVGVMAPDGKPDIYEVGAAIGSPQILEMIENSHLRELPQDPADVWGDAVVRQLVGDAVRCEPGF